MLFAAHDPSPANRIDPGLDLIEVIVQRNDTLEHIFRRLQLSLADLADVRALSGVQSMLDRLIPGEHLTLLHHESALVGLERRLSLTEELEVRRTDAGFQATLVPKAIDVEASIAHGVIQSSLFESANSAGLSDPSVLKLAKIFGSDIDFVLGLREGDQFVVSYERIEQNGHYVKDGDILAARFINQGRVYEAVRYIGPDGVIRYYSPDGRSMEKAFLRAPLEFKRISSGFSLARLHPILNLIRAHKGVDYAAPIGTPVYAAGSGRIKFRGEMGGYGNVLQIDHGNGIVTVYGHLSRFASSREGAHVERGDTIGYVGMTGLATGPHLHFEFRVNGQYIDPQKIKLPDALPIDASLYDDFKQQSAPLLAALNP
jgi:murein DD-endopeptidase MepM/ murein hydrolase activator NlpD